MLGRWLRKVVTSPGWQTVQQTSRDLRYLPNKLMREAGLEEIKDQLPKRRTCAAIWGWTSWKKMLTNGSAKSPTGPPTRCW